MPHFSIEFKASEKYCLIFNSCTDFTLNYCLQTTWIFRCTFGKVSLGSAQNRPCVLLWPNNRVAAEAQKSLLTSEPGTQFPRRISALGSSSISMTQSCTVEHLVHPVTKCPPGIPSAFGALQESTARFVGGQIWAQPSAWAGPGRAEPRGPAEPALLRLGHKEGAAEDQFLLSDMWQPCGQISDISAPVAVPWGAAWLWLGVLGSWIPTFVIWLGTLSWGGPGHPSPFRAGCGPCSPWNLPAFESQTIDRLQGLLQLSGTLHKVWHLLWLLILPAFPRKRLTQKGADSAIWSCLYSCTCKASRENVSWCLGRQIILRWKGFIAKFPRVKAWES